MRILFVGDVVGSPGRDMVEEYLPAVMVTLVSLASISMVSPLGRLETNSAEIVLLINSATAKDTILITIKTTSTINGI